jgi:limonene-1,2-epoxide hydrolase
MTNLERARLFYILPRITTQDRVDLIAMFHPDVRYIGVDKESARGSDAIERLFQKYEDSGHGVTDVKFDIRHIAENGDCVLVDMIDSFLIDGKPHSGVWSIVFEFDDEGLITFWQEHYNVAAMERAFASDIPVTESDPDNPARIAA